MRLDLANRWAAFASLSLIFFVVSAGTFNSLGVVLPAMVRELRWTWSQAGFGYTLLGLACGLASLLPAVLIRRVGVRGAMAVGTVALVAGFLAMGVTASVWLYLVGTVLIGCGFALVSTVPGTLVISSLFERRSTALGAYFTVGALGSVAGPLLSLLAMAGGWRGYWIAFAVVSALAGLFAVVTTSGKSRDAAAAPAPNEPVGPRGRIRGPAAWSVRRALATPQFYVIVGAYTMYLLINTTAHGFAVEHLTERGIDARVAAGALSLEALVAAGVALLGGLAGETISPRSLLLVSLVSLVVGTVGLAEARGYGLMLVYAVGVGAGYGLSMIASTLLLMSYFGQKPYLELYSIMALMSTSAAVGPALGGWARDALGGFEAVFLACAAAAGVLLLATLAMRPPASQDLPLAPDLGRAEP